MKYSAAFRVYFDTFSISLSPVVLSSYVSFYTSFLLFCYIGRILTLETLYGGPVIHPFYSAPAFVLLPSL